MNSVNNMNEMITNLLIFKKIGENKGVPKKESQRIGVISGFVKGDSLTKMLLPLQMIEKEEHKIKAQDARTGFFIARQHIEKFVTVVEDLDDEETKKIIKSRLPEIFSNDPDPHYSY
ncbi:MAG: hypothetical protein MI921_24230 [Cytophagales bacterium]|nr:hypothetical protein [Cytophagales bacterium]